jgi:NAD(P)-dependent dehydrogenase (short-subunit alcohol dehydrogenase family)
MALLNGKVAFITGASRGIGRAVALRYAQEGAHVILLARSVAGLEAVDDEIKAMGGTATLVPQDLAKHDNLPAIAPLIASRFGKLDIAVLNAALLGGLMPLHDMEIATWKKVMDVNVTANFILLKALHPLLKQSDAGRLIAVTSGITSTNRAYWGAYNCSKTALEKIILTYAEETCMTPIRAHLLNPGALRTDMRAEAMPGEDPTTLPLPESIAERFVELCL